MNRRARLLACIPLICLITVNGACLGGGAKPQSRLETQELRIRMADGTEVPVSAEIARTDEQRERGLMWRKTLADGEGMLFVFDRDRILSFWMKNTLLPLSIAYIAYDGRVLEIHDMEPRNLTPIQSARSARYALEAPQGWFTRMGIKVGDVLPELP
ncbi:hypothetical protein AGMMS4952_23820 [Spirochaetia bacterium]|nr:hypothetical protein AGMMS4952_23820 [Spirochaetia bacterium]